MPLAETIFRRFTCSIREHSIPMKELSNQSQLVCNYHFKLQWSYYVPESERVSELIFFLVQNYHRSTDYKVNLLDKSEFLDFEIYFIRKCNPLHMLDTVVD